MNPIKLPLLLFVLAFYSCQSGAEEERTIVDTHPELAEQLAEDSVIMPISNDVNSDLYQQYRITLDEYQGSGNYDVGDMYRGELAPLDVESHADALTYRTTFREGLEAGVNFAGQYTVVSVDCGTNCQLHYVVDRETGKVLDKLQSKMGADFRADSRLFVINPPDPTISVSECPNCMPEVYVFENGRFKKLPDAS